MCQNKILPRITGLFIHESPPLRAHISPINSTVLLIIRIIACLYLTGFYIYDFSDAQTLLNRFIFLTNVGYFFTWLYFVVVVQSRFIKISKDLDIAAELLFQTSFCIQVLITIIYWSVLFRSKDGVKFNNINWHAVPIFCLMLDFIFGSYRFIPSQFWSFVLLVLIYMFCINLPYSLAVRPVYGAASDWVGWLTYVIIIVGFVIGALSFAVGWGIYKKCKFPKMQEFQESQVKNNTNNDPIGINLESIPSNQPAPIQ